MEWGGNGSLYLRFATVLDTVLLIIQIKPVTNGNKYDDSDDTP